jgi:hypothetical protein
MDTGSKTFIFITYLSDSVSLQNFIYAKGRHVNCYVDLYAMTFSLNTQKNMATPHNFFQRNATMALTSKTHHYRIIYTFTEACNLTNIIHNSLLQTLVTEFIKIHTA